MELLMAVLCLELLAKEMVVVVGNRSGLDICSEVESFLCFAVKTYQDAD
jgi:hypothetical protein